LFYQESVDRSVREYFNLSDDEVRFIQRAARGENSSYSECLLSTTEHGRRRLEIYSGDFEHHVLEDQLNPWLWLDERDRLNERDRAWLQERDGLVSGGTVEEQDTTESVPEDTGRDTTPVDTEFDQFDEWPGEDPARQGGDRVGDSAQEGD
jgi:hypothetical protein